MKDEVLKVKQYTIEHRKSAGEGSEFRTSTAHFCYVRHLQDGTLIAELFEVRGGELHRKHAFVGVFSLSEKPADNQQ